MLYNPDHLAPNFKPLDAKVVNDLLKGKKFIPIQDLVRQPALTTGATEEAVRLGDGIHLLTTPKPKRREVVDPLDWVEAYHASVIPALALRAANAATLTEAHNGIRLLRQHLNYVLQALVLFRRNHVPPSLVLKYLESHRQQCMEHPESGITIADIDNAKWSALQQEGLMLANEQARRSAAAAAAAANDAHAHAQAHAHQRSANKPPRPGSAAATGHCGFFNSRSGCIVAGCTKTHACTVCASVAHGKAHCPSFKPKSAPQLPTTAAPVPKKPGGQ